MKFLKKHGVIVAAALIVVVVAAYYIPGAVRVTSNVNGKELPIYSVETDKKQVALSFDAAWGNEDTENHFGYFEKIQSARNLFYDRRVGGVLPGGRKEDL